MDPVLGAARPGSQEDARDPGERRRRRAAGVLARAQRAGLAVAGARRRRRLDRPDPARHRRRLPRRLPAGLPDLQPGLPDAPAARKQAPRAARATALRSAAWSSSRCPTAKAARSTSAGARGRSCWTTRACTTRSRPAAGARSSRATPTSPTWPSRPSASGSAPGARPMRSRAAPSSTRWAPSALLRALLERIAAQPGGGAQLARINELDARGAETPPTRATFGLAAICIAVYALRASSPTSPIFDAGYMSLALVRDGDLHRLVTAEPDPRLLAAPRLQPALPAGGGAHARARDRNRARGVRDGRLGARGDGWRPGGCATPRWWGSRGSSSGSRRACSGSSCAARRRSRPGGASRGGRCSGSAARCCSTRRSAS